MTLNAKDTQHYSNGHTNFLFGHPNIDAECLSPETSRDEDLEGHIDLSEWLHSP